MSQHSGHRAKKRFGQHFLASKGVVNNILSKARLTSSDKVLEIGPGLGAMTERLLEQSETVLAVELDRDAAKVLREKWPDLNLLERDAVGLDWSDLLSGEGWVCVSNLPYNVGTRIVTELVVCYPTVSRLVVMLQKEVALRMTARAGDRNRGSLSVFLSNYGQVDYCFKVPPGAFVPPPKVDSAVIEIVMFPQPRIGRDKSSDFSTFLKHLYSQPRKTLLNCLKKGYPKAAIVTSCATLGIDVARRPNTLDLEECQNLFSALEKH